MTNENELVQKCSICACEFDSSVGAFGFFGILPVAFCPSCLACMEDMFSEQEMINHSESPAN